MSRSHNDNIVSPAKKTFEWSSEAGQFKYYDKQEKKNHEVPLPFRFLILDKLTTIRGYSDADSSGFWSNEIKDTRKQKLTVRTKKGVDAEGLYADIKDRLAAIGAKYATQLYIAYHEEKELTIGCLTLVGASNSAFIDFSKTGDVYKGAIEVKDYTDAKKGATKYKVPNFKKIEVSDETDSAAKELDKQVQIYLTQMFERNNLPYVKEEKEEKVDNGNQNIRADREDDYSDLFPASENKDDLPF